jgi:hypothetical protein
MTSNSMLEKCCRKHVADGIEWAQICRERMFPIIWNGPTICLGTSASRRCCQWFSISPAFFRAAADGLECVGPANIIGATFQGNATSVQ